jgi:hypothetical protein
MKNVLKIFVSMMIASSCFAQTNVSNDLRDSLTTLKKGLQKHAISTGLSGDHTRFKAGNFDSCGVSYYFLVNGATEETMVDFQPISSSTGTINRSTDSSKNGVYISDKANDGTVTRNEALRRNNPKPNDENRETGAIGNSGFSFAYVLPDSIILATEPVKNRYSLTFAIKEQTDEYKIQERKTIYLNVKTKDVAEEIMKNMKSVISICKEIK